MGESQLWMGRRTGERMLAGKDRLSGGGRLFEASMMKWVVRINQRKEKKLQKGS